MRVVVDSLGACCGVNHERLARLLVADVCLDTANDEESEMKKTIPVACKHRTAKTSIGIEEAFCLRQNRTDGEDGLVSRKPTVEGIEVRVRIK
jgi:hypothetical protein